MKRVIFIILSGLLICSSVFSQGIERGMWQLQNPGQPYMNSIVTFKRGVFNNTMLNMTNEQSRQAIGSYNLSGSVLVIVINNTRYVYNLKWYSQNKFSLSNNQGTLIYAQSNSSADQYFANYMNWYGMNGGGLNSSSGGGNSSNRYEVCGTCRGTGRCKVCGGSGTYSGYGNSSPCSACNATGKCWKCRGTGNK